MNLVLKTPRTVYYLKTLKELRKEFTVTAEDETILIYLNNKDNPIVIFEAMLEFLGRSFYENSIRLEEGNYIQICDSFHWPRKFFRIKTRYYDPIKYDTISEDF